MTGVLTLYQSSIGKKAVMALTGFIGYGFVVAHMIGNLKIFEGSEGFNAYAHFLREVGYPLVPYSGLLWIARIVLLTAVILHVVSAIQLTRMGMVSRPVNYAQKKSVQASFASMTLRWGGIALLFFIIYHLLHFTIGAAHPNFVYGQAYENVVIGFQNPLIVLVYLVALSALAMHLYHGVWSMFQTLGLNNARTNSLWRGLATFSAIALFVGFALVPLSVMFNIVR
ncbi:MAG: succinate dehydrogenase cytochrome b subunit [Chloroflexota bacterium]